MLSNLKYIGQHWRTSNQASGWQILQGTWNDNWYEWNTCAKLKSEVRAEVQSMPYDHLENYSIMFCVYWICWFRNWLRQVGGWGSCYWSLDFCWGLHATFLFPVISTAVMVFQLNLCQGALEDFMYFEYMIQVYIATPGPFRYL